MTFETRWVLNYLARPQIRKQIQKIAAQQSPEFEAALDSRARSNSAKRVIEPSEVNAMGLRSVKPQIAENLLQKYAPLNCRLVKSQVVIYRPCLLGVCHVHYSHRRLTLDEWHKVSWRASRIVCR